MQTKSPTRFVPATDGRQKPVRREPLDKPFVAGIILLALSLILAIWSIVL